MGSGQSPVGSRVQQTHNSAEQHPRCGVSPRVYRPAGRQLSRWLCGHPSTVACGSNHNRPFSHLPQQRASTRSLILSLVESHEIMGVVLPSFRPPRAKLTVHEIQARLDAVRRQVLRQQVRSVFLAADRVESERSLGHLLLNPRRLQVNVSLFTQSSSLGDSAAAESQCSYRE